MDTKGAEFKFVKDELARHGLNPVVVEFGVLGEPAFWADVGRDEVVTAGGGDRARLRSGDHKDDATKTMTAGLYDEGHMDEVIGMGDRRYFDCIDGGALVACRGTEADVSTVGEVTSAPTLRPGT